MAKNFKRRKIYWTADYTHLGYSVDRRG